jgi:hypothetical protein
MNDEAGQIARERGNHGRRQQNDHERYCSGDPVRLVGTLYGLYDKDTYIDRIIGLLETISKPASVNAGRKWRRRGRRTWRNAGG